MENRTNRTSKSFNALILSALIITLLFVSTQAFAGRNFYFSTSIGNDSRTSTQAQNPSTPWKTIDKLNSFFTSLLPGDSVLFKKGESFYGKIIVAKSGTPILPIVIGAYGTGAKPEITGFTTLSSWTNEGGGIYSKAVTCESAPEMLTIDGVQFAMGRYPNSTWLTIDSYSGTNSITDADLNSSSMNWTGAEVVLRRSSQNLIDHCIITNHNSQTLNFNDISGYPLSVGWGYFIQNDLRTLDVFGEWYYNGVKLFMFFGAVDPTSKTVKVSKIDNLCTLIYINTDSEDYITIDNISFIGANKEAISGWRNNYTTIKNCNINFIGNIGIFGNRTTNLKVLNTNIDNSNDCGIYN